MINFKKQLSLYAIIIILITVGCSKQTGNISELKHYPIKNLEGIISKTDVTFDNMITSDNNGSLRINVNQPSTILLYETGDLDIENARLIYNAKVRTEGVEGNVYLEMWCQFTGKGEYFSRALQSPLSGSTDWSTQETPFFLKAGENPSNIKLNIVIDGRGIVWIDDIHLMKGPLK